MAYRFISRKGLVIPSLFVRLCPTALKQRNVVSCFCNHALLRVAQCRSDIRSQYGRCSYHTSRAHLYRRRPTDDGHSTEQRLITRIYQHLKKTNLDQHTLETYAERLQFLVTAGCQPYELVEYPAILQNDRETLMDFVVRYQMLGVSIISIPLLKFVKDKSWSKNASNGISSYLKKHGGKASITQEIRELLACSEAEMMNIVIKNPRLIGFRKSKVNVCDKIDYLLQNGARNEDIIANTHLLRNVPFNIIKSRVDRLVNLGANNPLHYAIIGRTVKVFEEYIELILEPWSVVSGQDCFSVIKSLSGFEYVRLHGLKPKVAFLLSEGYTPVEIREHCSILRAPLHKIRSSVAYLQQFYVDKVSLSLCRAQVQYDRLSSKSSYKSFHAISFVVKLLQCSAEQQASATMLNCNLRPVSSEDLIQNVVFFEKLGFSMDDLRTLPIALFHHPDILKQSHSVLQSHTKYHVWLNKWQDDPKKRLNLLQYFIEKSANFNLCAELPTEAADMEVNVPEAEHLDNFTDDNEYLEEIGKEQFSDTMSQQDACNDSIDAEGKQSVPLAFTMR